MKIDSIQSYEFELTSFVHNEYNKIDVERMETKYVPNWKYVLFSLLTKGTARYVKFLFSMALKKILIGIIDRFATNMSPHAALLFELNVSNYPLE